MKYIYSLCLLLLSPLSAYAHSKGIVAGFAEGLKHPVSGSDHLLAMLSVGIISAQMGGRALWSVPSTFVVFMLIGGLFGLYNIDLVAVEMGISISVIILGLIIAYNSKIHPYLSHIMVGIFAIFHGDAHGLEMPDMATSGLYLLGFLVTTILLHIAGLIIGHYTQKLKRGTSILRAIGLAIAALGFIF